MDGWEDVYYVSSGIEIVSEFQNVCMYEVCMYVSMCIYTNAETTSFGGFMAGQRPISCGIITVSVILDIIVEQVKGNQTYLIVFHDE